MSERNIRRNPFANQVLVRSVLRYLLFWLPSTLEKIRFWNTALCYILNMERRRINVNWHQLQLGRKTKSFSEVHLPAPAALRDMDWIKAVVIYVCNSEGWFFLYWNIVYKLISRRNNHWLLVKGIHYYKFTYMFSTWIFIKDAKFAVIPFRINKVFVKPNSLTRVR